LATNPAGEGVTRCHVEQSARHSTFGGIGHGARLSSHAFQFQRLARNSFQDVAMPFQTRMNGKASYNLPPNISVSPVYKAASPRAGLIAVAV
jgi:hypothetical protein